MVMQFTKTSTVSSIALLVMMIFMIMYYTYNKPKRTLATKATKQAPKKSYDRHRSKGNITRDCFVHIDRLIRGMIESYTGDTPTSSDSIIDTNVTKPRFVTRGSISDNINTTQSTVSRGYESKSRKKVVLAYTTYFGEKPWGWMPNSYAFNHWQGVECPYFKCELTFNRRDNARSDALIFHARDMPFIDTLRYIQQIKKPHHRWIYFAMESPLNNPPTTRLNWMFDWTMLYRNDSDIFRPYSYYFESSNIPKIPLHEFIEGKDRFVFWASSRCHLVRDEYVKKLMEYISIDVFGGCKGAVHATNKESCPKNSPNCEKKLKRYKFQLSFENSYCVDYITEKYWDALKRGVVPVVLGGAGYYKEIAVPGSFINAIDFPTVQKLADYLKSLDKNDTAYMEYFKWRWKYRVVDYPPWNCVLCARLHLDHKPKLHGHLDDVFNVQKQCGIHRNRLKKLVKTEHRSY